MVKAGMRAAWADVQVTNFYLILALDYQKLQERNLYEYLHRHSKTYSKSHPLT